MGFKCFLQHAGRGPGAGAGDRQQRPAPGRWRLGMREASTRTGPSLLALSNIGTGCEITWVLRNRPPASSHLPPWDLTPRTKHLMMTQHTPKKVKQRKRKKNQKATRPHIFPGEWCTLNAEVTSWPLGARIPLPHQDRTGHGEVWQADPHTPVGLSSEAGASGTSRGEGPPLHAGEEAKTPGQSHAVCRFVRPCFPQEETVL